jgi:hypothetical protein
MAIMIVKLIALMAATTPLIFPDSTVLTVAGLALYCRNAYLLEGGICGASNKLL